MPSFSLGPGPVASITDAQIRRVVGQAAYERAIDYADSGMVWQASSNVDGTRLTGIVHGSGYHSYQTLVSFDSSPGGWSSECTCPIHWNCKHGAALVMVARLQAARQPVVSWEEQIAQLLADDPVGCRPIALEMKLEPNSWRGQDDLVMTPLLQGKRGWIRTGCSWQQISRGHLRTDIDPGICSALEEITHIFDGYMHSGTHLSCSALGPRLWPVLERAVAAGLLLIADQHNPVPVRIVDGLQAGISLTTTDDGSVQIAAALDTSRITAREPDLRPSLGHLQPLGSPVHAFFAIQGGEQVILPLHPTPRPALGHLLQSSSARITVPAAEVPHFETHQLGALSKAVPVLCHDEALALPEPPQLRAVLGVSVDDTHHLTTRWSMRYIASSGEVEHRVDLSGLTEIADGSGLLAARRVAMMPKRALENYPLRDPRGEQQLARMIIENLEQLDPAHGATWNNQEHDGMGTVRFLECTLPLLQQAEGFDVEIDGELPVYKQAEQAPVITADITDDDGSIDWFSLKVHVRIGEEQIPLPDLMSAIATGQTVLLLRSGTWTNIDTPEINELARLMAEGRELADPDSPDTMRVSALHAGYYQALVALGVVGETTARWRRRILALLEQAEAAHNGTVGDEGILVPVGLQAELRPYQVEGYRWLEFLRAAGLGGILADDMGLGKTLQVLAVVQRLVEERARVRGADLAEGIPASPGSGAGAASNAATRSMPADPGSGVNALSEPGAMSVPAGQRSAIAALPGANMALTSVNDAQLDEVRADGVHLPEGPVLVVAPTSVVSAWAEQAARFCPDLEVRTLTRTSRRREESFDEIMAADLVITSYTIARLCEEEFTQVDFAWVVCDEAQFIKNRTSATYKAIRRLRAPSAMAITGTPMENSLMDLWSLMSIGAPGLLPAPDRFRELYRNPVDHGDRAALGRLRQRIRPFMLRRTKQQVTADLPAKTEQVIDVELGAAHRRAYDRRLARERQKVLGLLEQDTTQARFSALRSLMVMRQMALDPALVDGEENGSVRDGTHATGGRRNRSAKIATLLEHVEPVVAEGHRALVFSQFTRYLGMVRDELQAAGITTAYLDGATTNRAEVIEEFRTGGAQVFLISLKAGGFGLTLTEADYVFLLDPWWNPQAEEQAVDRAHRIGQDKPVMVYRLVSVDTIEEKVMALKARKAELFDRVVEGTSDEEALSDGASAGALSPAALTAAEIRELIA